MEKKKYYLVSAEALPEVFIKVAEAKRMLQVGEAATVGEAARMVGISRSAFYKYKDAVQPFQDMKAGHIIMTGADADILPGNCLPIANIPVGEMIHNIELHPGKGGQMVRSAGNSAQLMAKEGKYATLRLNS